MDRNSQIDTRNGGDSLDLIREIGIILCRAAEKFHWINGDLLYKRLIKKLLEIRLGDDEQSLQPIFIYGFRSFEDVLRDEQEYPRLLVSPGIQYLQLPTSSEQFKLLIERALTIKIKDKETKLRIMRDYAGVAQTTLLEAVLAHDVGNFLGYKHLLYGAYLNRMIEWNNFQNICNTVKQQQANILPKLCADHEYRLYLMREEAQYAMVEEKDRSDPPEPVKGRILYIDDHGSLGWGHAVAAAIFGSFKTKKQKMNEWPQNIYYQHFKANNTSKLLVLGRYVSQSISEHIEKNEADYVTAVEQFIEEQSLEDYDLILLDLRLKWRGDEKGLGLSGIRILEKIRDRNRLIPVIVLTASRRASNMRAVLDAGADSYFIKDLPSFPDDREGVKEYHLQFMETVKTCLEVAYIRHVWGYISMVSEENLHERIKGKIQIQQVRDQINKALGFLKILPTSFHAKSFGLTTIAEALVALNEPYEILRNISREEKIEGRFFPNLPDWRPENLLYGLRSFCVHGNSSGINHEDIKAALYLFFRLFVPGEKLLELSKQLFKSGHSFNFDVSFREVVDKKIVSLAGIESGQRTREVIDKKNNIKYNVSANTKGIEIEALNKKATFKYGKFSKAKNELNLTLNSSRDNNPLFLLTMNNKDAYYLFALSRVKSFDSLDECDRVFLGYIANRLGLSNP